MAHPQTRADTQHRTTATIELVAGTPVLTLRGTLPAEALRRTDRLVTRAGAVPLARIAILSVQRDDLLRVSARALGHDRPEDDLLLPADQPVLLRDWRAKALYGAAEATVAVRRLIDGTYIRPEGPVKTRIVRLTLARPAVLYAGGLELAARRQTARV